MSNKLEFITSPVGKILFLALRNPVPAIYGDSESPKVYVCRLEIDGTTAEGKAFRKEVEAINPNIIGTKNAKEGHYTVKAASKYLPTVFDSEGEAIKEKDSLPFFSKGSTGTARMQIKPFTGNKLGGSINLLTVQLFDLELVKTQEGPSVMEQLQAALKS